MEAEHLQISKLLWGVTNPINIELILEIGVSGFYLHFNILFLTLKVYSRADSVG